MAEDLHLNPLTGHGEFDRLIAEFSDLRDTDQMDSARQSICTVWTRQRLTRLQTPTPAELPADRTLLRPSLLA